METKNDNRFFCGYSEKCLGSIKAKTFLTVWIYNKSPEHQYSAGTSHYNETSASLHSHHGFYVVCTVHHIAMCRWTNKMHNFLKIKIICKKLCVLLVHLHMASLIFMVRNLRRNRGHSRQEHDGEKIKNRDASRNTSRSTERKSQPTIQRTVIPQSPVSSYALSKRLSKSCINLRCWDG